MVCHCWILPVATTLVVWFGLTGLGCTGHFFPGTSTIIPICMFSVVADIFVCFLGIIFCTAFQLYMYREHIVVANT